MQKRKKTYSLMQKAGSVFMMLTLVWLTISIPYVYMSKLQLAADGVASVFSPTTHAEEESHNPFGNTTEEKGPNTNSIAEEYLHDHHGSDNFFSFTSRIYNCTDSGTYHAFHGELLVPPPNSIA